MKRIISIILAITTIACFFSIGAFAAAAPGDVTGDGQINSEDALEILMVSVELKTATEEQMKVGDVDLSGDFTSSDALLVLLYSVDAEIKVQKNRETHFKSAQQPFLLLQKIQVSYILQPMKKRQ